MSTERLLTIEPDVLNFPFEMNKEISCTIRLSNNTRKNVTFKVMTTSPLSYTVRPNFGILLPRSTCEVTVTMRGPKKVPSNMHCKDRFLIRSVLARPGDTKEDNWTQFRESGRNIEDLKLRVVYVLQSNMQLSASRNPQAGSSMRSSNSGNQEADSDLQSSNFENSEAGPAPQVPTCRQRNSNATEVEGNGSHLYQLLLKGIIFGFLGLVLWYIIMKLLPLIWSLTFVVMMFVTRMIRNLVSDSVDDWVTKAVLYACLQFLSLIFPKEMLNILVAKFTRCKERMNKLIMKILG